MAETNKPLDLLSLSVQFYELIATLKTQIRQGVLDDVIRREMALDEAPKPEEIAYAAQARLRRWLENTRQNYKERNTARENAWMNSAIYAMAALADELMLFEVEWVGQPYWQDVLLEEALFKSCRAGTSLFELMDRLVAARSHNDTERQLAAVYLLVLRLGFSGRYRNEPEALNRYRRQLYRLVNMSEDEGKRPICADAYQHQLVSRQQQRMAPIGRWYRKVGLAALGYLVVSTLIWGLINWQLNSWIAKQIALAGSGL